MKVVDTFVEITSLKYVVNNVIKNDVVKRRCKKNTLPFVGRVFCF